MIERVHRVKHRDQILKYVAILLPGDVHKCLHRYVILGALEPANDILTHLGLVLAITEWARVFERLNGSLWKHAYSTSPERAPARAPVE